MTRPRLLRLPLLSHYPSFLPLSPLSYTRRCAPCNFARPIGLRDCSTRTLFLFGRNLRSASALAASTFNSCDRIFWPPLRKWRGEGVDRRLEQHFAEQYGAEYSFTKCSRASVVHF